MRNAILLLFCTFFFLGEAQDCSADRYVTNGLFDVDTTKEVLFGQNIDVAGTDTQLLYMDVYEPAGDTVSKRPVIFVGFGGSFVGGNRGDVSGLCHRWASMGYVAVAFDYRVGFFIPNERSTTLAVVRGMHDMRAAIRYMYRDAATTNTFRVDTNRVIASGVSAGAVTALQVAYLNEVSEIPAVVQDDVDSLGGLEGLSGVPGYSSKVHAVVNFSGALGDTSWMDPGDPVLISFHDNGDDVVPYDTREIVVGIPTGLVASGSGDITARAQHVGIASCLYTIEGDGHVSFLRSGAAFSTDSVFHYMNPWLKDAMCATATDCNSQINYATGLLHRSLATGKLTILGNGQANGSLSLMWENPTVNKAKLEVVDVSGKRVFTEYIRPGATQWSGTIPGLVPGIYYLRLADNEYVRMQTLLHKNL